MLRWVHVFKCKIHDGEVLKKFFNGKVKLRLVYKSLMTKSLRYNFITIFHPKYPLYII